MDLYGQVDTQIQVSALYYYPVKSCRGIALPEAQIDQQGICRDRRLMIVDPNGRFLTQRGHPRVALVEALIEDTWLTLKAPDMPALTIQFWTAGQEIDVTLWGDQCKAVDQGKHAALWLSKYVGVPCRLVHIPDGYVRQVDQRYALNPEDQVGFADGFPFLLISQASLDDLNSRLVEQVPMERFRPNIVVTGCQPFAEDTWKRIRIGEIEFNLVKPCARCVVTLIDQKTGIQYKEPLRTLATYRHFPGKGVLFGQNLTHNNVGTIRVEQKVQVLEYRMSKKPPVLVRT